MRAFLRLSAVALVAGLLAGCAGAKSVESVADNPANYPSDIAATAELTAVTTRAPVARPMKAPWYGSERGESGSARVRLASPHRAGRFSMAAAGLSDWRIESVEPVPSSSFAGPAGGTRDVLVYIHGFNESFVSAALDAARLSDALTFRGNTVLFSWPSRNSVLDYMADRESAMWSRDALETMFQHLLSDPGVGRVHIVAHSMGSMLTVEALRQVHASNRGNMSRFGAIVFASPDIDVDGFSASVKRMGTLHRNMTVISSQNDRALALSGGISGGKRLGRAESAALQKLGIKVVDTSGMAGGLLSHATFLRDGDVQKIIVGAIAAARSGRLPTGPSPFPVFESSTPVVQQPLASVAVQPEQAAQLPPPAPMAAANPPMAAPAPMYAPAPVEPQPAAAPGPATAYPLQ